MTPNCAKCNFSPARVKRALIALIFEDKRANFLIETVFEISKRDVQTWWRTVDQINIACVKKCNDFHWMIAGDGAQYLSRRWRRASYNVTDAGTCSQLWVSWLRADCPHEWLNEVCSQTFPRHFRKEETTWALNFSTMHFKRRNFRNYFNFVAFVQLKMYEINFDTKFLPPGLLALRLPLLVFISFCQFESTKLNSIRKVLEGKVRNFSPTKNFFFYSNVLCIVLSLATETISKWRLLFQSPFLAVIYSLNCFFSFRKKRFFL